MTDKIITSRRLENMLRSLGQSFTKPKSIPKPDWTDEQLKEAYARLSPLYGKKCILEYQLRDEQRTKEGILRPAYTSIGFTHYMRGRRPSLTLFSIEDLEIIKTEPILLVKTDVSCWNDFPYYRLGALEARIQLYFARVRRPKAE